VVDEVKPNDMNDTEVPVLLCARCGVRWLPISGTVDACPECGERLSVGGRPAQIVRL
jgi:DNA-directed RNA polymerase subunit RPC12/RpoP